MGTFEVDDSETFGPDFSMRFFAPTDDEESMDNDAQAADIVHDVIAALPDGTVASSRMLYAEMRKAAHQLRDASVRDAVDDLIVIGRLAEVPGKRGAKGYRAVLTASHDLSP